MYWTLELASKLEDAPWPATKDEWKWRMKVKYMKVLKIFGLIIQVRKISSSTRKNISVIVSTKILLNPCKSVRFAGI